MPELIWKGKYDEKGDLRPVDRTILPFQTVETVNESKADRQTNLLFRRQESIIANPGCIPDDVREGIRKSTDYVGYWAIDWDYKAGHFPQPVAVVSDAKGAEVGDRGLV